MAAQIVLKATRGGLDGQEFVLTGNSRYVLGRSSGCFPRLPPGDLTVSRFHCLIEVDPPAAWVEDLGSLNGTYVNDQLIGQRVEGCSGNADADAGDAEACEVGPCPLEDGDHLTIGGNEFAVVIDEVSSNVGTNKFPRPQTDAEVRAGACLLSA